MCAIRCLKDILPCPRTWTLAALWNTQKGSVEIGGKILKSCLPVPLALLNRLELGQIRRCLTRCTELLLKVGFWIQMRFHSQRPQSHLQRWNRKGEKGKGGKEREILAGEGGVRFLYDWLQNWGSTREASVVAVTIDISVLPEVPGALPLI